MRIRRRSLRKLLIAVGCVVGTVAWPAAAVGGALMVAGGALHLWSKGCLEQNRRLTTTGPYRWSRNPFYLGNLLIDLGLCCVIGRWWVGLVFLPIWFVAYRGTIQREEERLGALFPDRFGDYAKAVPALIPTGRRLPADRAEGSFSWQNPALARGSEYARLLGIALAPWAIAVAESIREGPLLLFTDAKSLELAGIAFLGVGWVVKLALAETFRRPQTALLPRNTRSAGQSLIGVALVGVALAEGHAWAASLPVMWFFLVGLDRIGASRARSAEPEGIASSDRRSWRYFPRIAIASIGVFAVLTLCVRSFGG